MKYQDIKPISKPVPADRQGAKRHYGVHPYFTRRPFNVVRSYILRYSKEGDSVLDPFGGSGVTAVEAWLENRRGIQNDINPLANFIAKGIVGLSRGGSSEYKAALERLENRCQPLLLEVETLSDVELSRRLKKADLPPNAVLPANADEAFLYDLFSQRQLFALAMLRHEILKLEKSNVREGMMLAFSASLTKLNKTFLSANGRAASRGGSSIFSIYRYKVAKEPVYLEYWNTFFERALNVIDAKAEIDRSIEAKQRAGGFTGAFECHDRDVLALPKLFENKVDYIFTDPPYGGHIAYMDLSTMWNAWLGNLPTVRRKDREIIVGGDAKHSEERYVEGLREGIRSCVKMLKKNRWMSIVFQHWNIGYFHAILSAAAESGADLRAAVSQVGDPIWSMHKKKGSDSVLAGELILTFIKTGKPIQYEAGRSFDLETVVGRLVKEAETPLYGEALFNDVVLNAWQSGALDSLNVSRTEFSDLLLDMGLVYNDEKHFWLKEASARLL